MTVRSSAPPAAIVPILFDAAVFDLDGVLTETASIHAQAWKRLFDEFLARQAAATGKAQPPFDADSDYRLYVDGRPRADGVRTFLAARGIIVSHETVRCWAEKFRWIHANKIRRRAPQFGDKWHLDEVVITISGK